MSGRPSRREREGLRAARRPVYPQVVQVVRTAEQLKKCPRPKKEAFGSQADAATMALRASRVWGVCLAPYWCECGTWHLAGADRVRKYREQEERHG